MLDPAVMWIIGAILVLLPLVLLRLLEIAYARGRQR